MVKRSAAPLPSPESASLDCQAEVLPSVLGKSQLSAPRSEALSLRAACYTLGRECGSTNFVVLPIVSNK